MRIRDFYVLSMVERTDMYMHVHSCVFACLYIFACAYSTCVCRARFMSTVHKTSVYVRNCLYKRAI